MPRIQRRIDADGQPVEPPHLREARLAPEFHDRAPRLVKDEAGEDAWYDVGEDVAPPRGDV